MPATPRAPKFTVIMPAYNEARHIRKNVLETAKVMDSLAAPYEIIVVDDGSRDQTAQEVRAVADGETIRLVEQRPNQGKGCALRAGFAQSRGELVFFLDSDLDLPARQLLLLEEIMRSSGRDAVIGSKRHPQTVLHYPWKRRLFSTVYFFMVKLMFGLPISDTQTGIKLFKREVLAMAFAKMLVKKYAFDLELLVLAHVHGYRIAEAPVVVNYQPKYGHIGPKDIFNIFWDTLAIFYRLHVKRYYD